MSARRWLPRDWPPRDWRMLLALVFLAGGGVAVTLLAGAALYSIGWMQWPAKVAPERIRWLGYFGLVALGLIAIVLTSFGFVLGRRAWKVKAGAFDASAVGGEETAPAGAIGGERD
ncbi:hypothetical protein M9978_08400 [Sphingomonas sp. MG17]|uniref:Uncharacterized protein n=1 Tax=Sphingomonas tagetis TaxID=2949092 RepID=A0A9X2HGN2_9SPHN|nr:hypothetical protein [Sphingomonas tagetis]MCP3730448.1 hypothetical protein [Sphingomonas tagetis]